MTQQGQAMPRYFFDTHDGVFQRDEDGIECPNFEAARREAMASLPEMARWSIPNDDDSRAFTIFVRDECGAVVYTGTLTFSGLTLECAAA